MIAPPRHEDQYPDRGLDCQQAAHAAFRDLWEGVAAAGWSAEEIAAAIYELTDHHLTALRANAETEAQIAVSKDLSRGQALAEANPNPTSRGGCEDAELLLPSERAVDGRYDCESQESGRECETKFVQHDEPPFDACETRREIRRDHRESFSGPAAPKSGGRGLHEAT
jgi:hypothetical protein